MNDFNSKFSRNGSIEKILITFLRVAVRRHRSFNVPKKEMEHVFSGLWAEERGHAGSVFQVFLPTGWPTESDGAETVRRPAG